MALPFLAPPGMFKARVDALRKAFVAASKDRRFLEAAEWHRFPVDPADGTAVQQVVNDITTRLRS